MEDSRTRLQIAQISEVNLKFKKIKSGIMEVRNKQNLLETSHIAKSSIHVEHKITKLDIILFIASGFMILMGIIFIICYFMDLENTGFLFAGILFLISSLLALLFELMNYLKMKKKAKVLSGGSNLESISKNQEIKRLLNELYVELEEAKKMISNLKKIYTGDMSILFELENDSFDLKRALDILSNRNTK